MIKPCPACGNKAVKPELNSYNDTFFIRCCVVCVPSGETEQEVIDIWNGMVCYNWGEKEKKDIQHLFDAYVRTRLEYSGSLGNLSNERKREVIVHEILTELGWDTQSMK